MKKKLFLCISLFITAISNGNQVVSVDNSKIFCDFFIKARMLPTIHPNDPNIKLEIKNLKLTNRHTPQASSGYNIKFIPIICCFKEEAGKNNFVGFIAINTLNDELRERPDGSSLIAALRARLPRQTPWKA